MALSVAVPLTPAGAQPSRVSSATAPVPACGEGGFFEALSAVRHGSVVRVRGHKARFTCTAIAEYYKAAGTTTTLRLRRRSHVSVFTHPGTSMRLKSISRFRLRHYLAHANGQFFFKVRGPHTNVSRMASTFVS